MPNRTWVAVGSRVFVGTISVAIEIASVSGAKVAMGCCSLAGAAQAVRIMAIAVTSKVMRNKLWYIVFPSFYMNETKQNDAFTEQDSS